MKPKLMAVVSAAMIALTAAATLNEAQARWYGHGGWHGYGWRGGWWVPGAVAGGLALGVAIASRPYYYGYGPYYAYDYGPDYYGGGPYYYGGGPYYYGGPRYYYYHRPYKHWTEF